ncbi:PEPxxWA-CTERM sorting domain-containing protein [Sphingomonas sp. AP4-R1]|uniref:glycerophosphodiester phosphodiesterase family protein n=1 Tax=Sphingomonas sp. AP4-R1 TaxID=2735134 RepID=UPI00149356B1|nr:glycerophosphodiester phosphodiesterase family protein [Sphingomonas sp. AP4-R1]QJU57094.1 PEPxxWA-CTERM sorting domain-containing protein [Sphingomonas sp. AP4-R1]
MKAFRFAAGVTALLVSACLAPVAAQAADPIVIAHRGASGYLPEHTLAGYELAVRMGADFIEPDLQFTSDGQLVAMHDATLNRTTNVATLFAPRNGGYRVEDFSLAEIKTLTVKPVGTAQTSYPGFTPANAEMRVPTFQEVIDLAKQQSAATGRTVGIYPEAKQADPAMENAIISTLKANGYGTTGDKLFVQSFSDQTIRSIEEKSAALGMDLATVVLGYATTDSSGAAAIRVGTRVYSMQEIASFTDGIGLSLSAAITADYIAQAHAVGLQVHGWTFSQADPTRAAAQFASYLAMGMDGVFANYPDLAVAAVDTFSSAVPEASTWMMMLVGFGGVGFALRRRKPLAAAKLANA